MLCGAFSLVLSYRLSSICGWARSFCCLTRLLPTPPRFRSHCDGIDDVNRFRTQEPAVKVESNHVSGTWSRSTDVIVISSTSRRAHHLSPSICSCCFSGVAGHQLRPPHQPRELHPPHRALRPIRAQGCGHQLRHRCKDLTNNVGSGQSVYRGFRESPLCFVFSSLRPLTSPRASFVE